jgi:hypothetical protein
MTFPLSSGFRRSIASCLVNAVRVISVREAVDRPADKLSVQILEARVNLVPAFRPESHQSAAFVPPVMVLKCLEYGQINAQLMISQFAIDLGQNIAEVGRERYFDPRKALFKLAHQRFVEPRGAAPIYNQSALLLGQ